MTAQRIQESSLLALIESVFDASPRSGDRAHAISSGEPAPLFLLPVRGYASDLSPRHNHVSKPIQTVSNQTVGRRDDRCGAREQKQAEHQERKPRRLDFGSMRSPPVGQQRQGTRSKCAEIEESPTNLWSEYFRVFLVVDDKILEQLKAQQDNQDQEDLSRFGHEKLSCRALMLGRVRRQALLSPCFPRASSFRPSSGKSRARPSSRAPTPPRAPDAA